MKKADFFVDEFITEIISKKKQEEKNNEWLKIEQKLHFVKDIQLHWYAIISSVVENTNAAEKLAKETYPTHIQDESLYIKVSNADESMLISLHTQSLIRHIKQKYAQHNSKNNHAQLSQSLMNVRTIYHIP